MTTFRNAFKFITLMQARRRVSIRRLAEELGCCERNVYYLVQQASCENFPIRLEAGIVIYNGISENPFK